MRKITLLTIASLFLSLAPMSVGAAATTYYASNQNLAINNANLTIAAGSAADSFTQTATGFSVSVPAGEAFIVRANYPTSVYLENDALLAACTVTANKDNQLLILGPRQVQVTVSGYNCNTDASTTSTVPIIGLDQPTSGTKLSAGNQVSLFWQTSGGGSIPAVRLRLSTDGGTTFPISIIDNAINTGFFTWTVPTVYATEQAIIKIDGKNGQGGILATSVSPTFIISGEAAPIPELDFSPAAVTNAADTIDTNQSLMRAAGSAEPACTAGLRIRTTDNPAVYFCGADGKRHAFPNQKIHDSWYVGDFAGVATVTATTLAGIPLGANVKYRPGVHMVKIQTDPKVYAVAANGELRWIPTESIALELYGADWNKFIDDVPDSFFADYRIGEPIAVK